MDMRGTKEDRIFTTDVGRKDFSRIQIARVCGMMKGGARANITDLKPAARPAAVPVRHFSHQFVLIFPAASPRHFGAKMTDIFSL